MQEWRAWAPESHLEMSLGRGVQMAGAMDRRTLRKGTFCVLLVTSSIFQGNPATHSKNLPYELTSLCHFVLWLMCMGVRGDRKEDDGCCHSGIKSMCSDIYLTGHRGDYKQLGFLFTEGATV